MLEARHLAKRFFGISVVNDVSFDVRAGEVVGYLGPNGSGKSTTAKMLTGLLDTSEGTVLFNGQTPTELRGYKQPAFPADRWVIEGDALKTVPGRAVDLVTVQQYESFELELEWKVAPGGNSGLMYHVAETDGPPWSTGPEFQLLDDSRHPDGRNPLTSAGALYGHLAPSANKVLQPVGSWNTSRVVFKDNHVEHWMNGVKVVDYTWGSPEIAALTAKSKFAAMPGFMKGKTGHVCIQHHGEEAWFRNIRIRRL